jgi:hypothetical protein
VSIRLQVNLDPREVQLWAELDTDAMDVTRAADALMALREQGVGLSSRSADFLALDEHSAAGRAAFAQKWKGKALTQPTCATCMESIKRNMEEVDAQVSEWVLATRAARHVFEGGSCDFLQMDSRAELRG